MADDVADRFEARHDRSGPGGRGKGRGGGGGGRGRGRGRESDLSHALSRLLRHQAESAGITLDREGYAPLDRVVSPVTTHLCFVEAVAAK
jgi:2'-phosphotransferase